MSKIFSALKHNLGIVEGILIPGASASTTDSTHQIQQTVADAYGAAIKTAVTKLGADDTMTGPEKSAAIATAVTNDIISKGVKAEFKALRDIVLDVVQAAYRAAEPSIGADIIALAAAFHVGPVLTAVIELVVPVVQKAADDAAQGPAGIALSPPIAA